MFLENNRPSPENYESPEMDSAEIEALVEKFKEKPELYDEWKKQQPVNYTREWIDNHNFEKIRDYSRAELVIGLKMDDLEIMDALGVSYPL